ncbi:nuclear autoantigen Sp-100 isoform X4 [Phacochoerus africanus]|uniref:nuclear autoantigen Sp-100 isoform X4 n=1 Tax=Phacochoerus africanus TaxID=41426 RepID=UPI001FD93365|nr:nuclear autoantigen Sp-100 isoform X4 [Phacochoerus africanus]
MASGGRELRTRMSVETRNTDDELIYEIVFNHFRRHKVEISNAIKKPFPFLEGLRDRELITNKMYEDFQDSCRNLVPVPRVVYKVLSELEKTFDLPLLEALFSEVNMQEYPDLNQIYKSFENVIQEKLNHEEGDREEREERPNVQLRLQQGSDKNSFRSLTWLSRRFSSYDEYYEQAHDESDNGDARKEMPNPEPTDEKSAKLSNHGYQINSCSVYLVDIKKEKPFLSSEFEFQSQASDIIVISSEDSAGSGDGEMSSGASRSAQRTLPDLPNTENKAFYETSNRKRRTSFSDASELSDEGASQKPYTSFPGNGSGTSFSDASELSDEGASQKPYTSFPGNGSDTSDSESNSTLGKHSGKRKRKRGRPKTQSKRAPKKRGRPRGKKTANTGPRKKGGKRGPRIPRVENMDFQSPQLPVTCGPAEGVLYKKKMEQGIWQKCIKSKNGKWFTLKEFEAEGKHEASKNWKMSLRCGGSPLKILIENGHLPVPPRKRKKETSGKCAVCEGEEELFSCDTCSRFFHENCHVQPKDANSYPWSCIFCKIKALQEKCPESQPRHQESEVLKRQMLPDEQLKCEFLLLKVYCCPKSPFFASEPYFRFCQQSRTRSRVLAKPMWLDKIKKKLTRNIYCQVEWFIQDMRLIFQNHRVFYKNKNFINLGLQLEDKFENYFKDIFGIQEISTKSSQCEPRLS